MVPGVLLDEVDEDTRGSTIWFLELSLTTATADLSRETTLLYEKK